MMENRADDKDVHMSGTKGSCNQCGHVWTFRDPGHPPLKCPSCRSFRWNAPTASVLTCHRCGHTWKNRVGIPTKCPSCQSMRWDEDPHVLFCHRCGHRWPTRMGRSQDDVTLCPRCKSRKWMEPTVVLTCESCGWKYASRTGRCPSCQGRHSLECTCPSCGSAWLTSDRSWKVCPFCDRMHVDEPSVQGP